MRTYDKLIATIHIRQRAGGLHSCFGGIILAWLFACDEHALLRLSKRVPSLR